MDIKKSKISKNWLKNLVLDSQKIYLSLRSGYPYSGPLLTVSSCNDGAANSRMKTIKESNYLLARQSLHR